jgi:hypothetical protein
MFGAAANTFTADLRRREPSRSALLVGFGWKTHYSGCASPSGALIVTLRSVTKPFASE